MNQKAIVFQWEGVSGTDRESESHGRAGVVTGVFVRFARHSAAVTFISFNYAERMTFE